MNCKLINIISSMKVFKNLIAMPFLLALGFVVMATSAILTTINLWKH